jgi:AbrB family looped-hinge helix DNA binding protein
MAKVSSRLQVTIPKAVADLVGIEPGDEIELIPAGDGIRIELPHAPMTNVRERLRIFDAATRRQRARERREARHRRRGDGRGWTREGLYAHDPMRGRPSGS